MDTKEIDKIANYCEKNLCLENRILDEVYFYQSLPLCVIDAVWSIGVKYEAVKKVINNYYKYFNLECIRKNRNKFPLKEEQQSISDFLDKKNTLKTEKFTNEIFRNKQRTSSRNGILKTEAVFMFASVLKEYGVEYLQDVKKITSDNSFEKSIKKIPGQKSGISLKYFFMLCGENDLVKPDRMILRFLSNILQRELDLEESVFMLRKVTERLKIKHKDITPIMLDNIIWKYQRTKK